MSSIAAANLFGVKGLVAVVTGGGTGIGLMMAKVLEENGAKVYIVGRRAEVLEKAAKEGRYGNIIPMQGDACNKDDLERIAGEIKAAEGFINTLIINHGNSGADAGLGARIPENSVAEIQAALWKADMAGFTRTFDINVTSVYFAIVAFMGLLDAGNKKGNVEQKSQVIANASVAGLMRIPPGSSAYATSKAAVIHLIKVCSSEFAPIDIRANAIAPGWFPSEMTVNYLPIIAPGGKFPKTEVPAEKPGSLEDMAGPILFLASRAGGYLNGNLIVNDGGMCTVMPSTY